VSAALISEVTDSVMEEVKAWQDRPLEALYPIVYLDALMVKMRQDGKVDNRAVYTAIGINMDGEKSVLGLWTNSSEGAKFWMSVLTNLKNRGMKDAFIICTDGLKGFPDAIEAVFPSALVQTCIVHLIRASLNFVNWKERKAMAADLKTIYRAPSADTAEMALKAFRIKYPKHQVVADVWERNWQRVIPFFEFPEEIRKIIYTTNAVESLHMTLRKVTKNRGSFPTQDAAIKLLYLALQNVAKKWHAVQGWREALHVRILYPPSSHRSCLPPVSRSVRECMPTFSGSSANSTESALSLLLAKVYKNPPLLSLDSEGRGMIRWLPSSFTKESLVQS
jgi:putative transposase